MSSSSYFYAMPFTHRSTGAHSCAAGSFPCASCSGRWLPQTFLSVRLPSLPTFALGTLLPFNLAQFKLMIPVRSDRMRFSGQPSAIPQLPASTK